MCRKDTQIGKQQQCNPQVAYKASYFDGEWNNCSDLDQDGLTALEALGLVREYLLFTVANPQSMMTLNSPYKGVIAMTLEVTIEQA
jgi:hypothetical protein